MVISVFDRVEALEIFSLSQIFLSRFMMMFKQVYFDVSKLWQSTLCMERRNWEKGRGCLQQVIYDFAVMFLQNEKETA